MLADPATAPELRERLELVQELRAFAAGLDLAVGDQYTSYADWPGDRLVTAVVASRPGEVEPAGFRFPWLGTVPYKGFFETEAAEREAARLRGQGLDTCLVPVRAYSTLGWIGDPVTGPLARLGPGAFAETLLHELVHATVFVSGEPDFNEGIASFIGQEAAVRFFAERNGAASREAAAQRARVRDDRALARALGALRQDLRALYAAVPAGPERDAARAALELGARRRVAGLPLAGGGAGALAAALRLNDACLALSGTYEQDLDAYARRLRELDGDLRRFVGLVRAADGADPRAAVLGAASAGGSPGR